MSAIVNINEGSLARTKSFLRYLVNTLTGPDLSRAQETEDVVLALAEHGASVRVQRPLKKFVATGVRTVNGESTRVWLRNDGWGRGLWATHPYSALLSNNPAAAEDEARKCISPDDKIPDMKTLKIIEVDFYPALDKEVSWINGMGQVEVTPNG